MNIFAAADQKFYYHISNVIKQLHKRNIYKLFTINFLFNILE